MQWLIGAQATTMHHYHCNRKEVLKKADTRGVIEGILLHGPTPCPKQFLWLF